MAAILSRGDELKLLLHFPGIIAWMELFVVVFLGAGDLWSSARTTAPGAWASTESGRVGAPSGIAAERDGGPRRCLTRCGPVVGQSEPGHAPSQPAYDTVTTARREPTTRSWTSHSRDHWSVWTCKSYLSLVNSCIDCAYQTYEIYQVLPYSVDFKAPVELWNPLSKTVHSWYSFIWNKGLVNIWNDCKAQK